MLFESTADKNLTGFAVWVPRLGGQERNVPSAASLAPDPRIHHYWDDSNDVGVAYETVLPINGETAWDVYMLYRPGIRWSGALPPKPDFWMHQLSSAVAAAPRLDPDAFATRARQLLSKR